MKEIRDLARKNECFSEIKCSSLTQVIKDRALLLLMFMVIKKSEIKTYGAVAGNRQRL